VPGVLNVAEANHSGSVAEAAASPAAAAKFTADPSPQEVLLYSCHHPPPPIIHTNCAEYRMRRTLYKYYFIAFTMLLLNITGLHHCNFQDLTLEFASACILGPQSRGSRA
jgi:hypothetical protein